MYAPPPDHRMLPAVAPPTWRRILASTVVVTTVPFVLWFASQPVTGVVVLATVLAIGMAARGTVRLARCLADCGGFALDLGGCLQIIVTRTDANDWC